MELKNDIAREHYPNKQIETDDEWGTRKDVLANGYEVQRLRDVQSSYASARDRRMCQVVFVRV